MLSCLPPVVSPATRLLVLGSFPGVASLAAQQYYAHPRNHFWPIVTTLLAEDAVAVMSQGYAARCAWLLQQGIGLWDVYATCDRRGSLDSAIRDARTNDFGALRQRCPALRAIAHNGAESYRHARHTAALSVPVLKLPSTSPANASWSLERKLTAWRDALRDHELMP